MTSFSIADSKTSIDLTSLDGDEADVREGEISFTVRNITDKTEAARLRIETADGAEDDWFSFEEAATTNPGFLESDFEGGSARTVKINIRAKGNVEELTCKFRIRATAESNPDNDFIEGPWVQVTVAKVVVVPPPPKCRWCKPAAMLAVVVVIVIGGFLMWDVLFGNNPDSVYVRDMTFEDAEKALNDAGFNNILPVTMKETVGLEPGNAIKANWTTDAKEEVSLYLDPGVPIKAEIGQHFLNAIEVLRRDGLFTKIKVKRRKTGPYWKVTNVNPVTGTAVIKGKTVTITYHKFGKPFSISDLTLNQAQLKSMWNSSASGSQSTQTYSQYQLTETTNKDELKRLKHKGWVVD